MKKITSFSMILLAALQLSGCMSATYVSAIGLRKHYSTVEPDNAGARAIKTYETSMTPIGGPCTSFVPYVSLAPDTKKMRLVDQRPYTGQALPPDREYRKWYGYPAQALQLVALPLDVVIDVAIMGAGIIVSPFMAIHDHFSGPASPTPSTPPSHPEGQSAR